MGDESLQLVLCNTASWNLVEIKRSGPMRIIAYVSDGIKAEGKRVASSPHEFICGYSDVLLRQGNTQGLKKHAG